MKYKQVCQVGQVLAQLIKSLAGLREDLRSTHQIFSVDPPGCQVSDVLT